MSSSRYSVRHQTRYLYSDSVAISYNRIHCQPRLCPWQTFENPRLSVDPEPEFLARQTDFFGNPVSFFTVQEPHKDLTVTVMLLGPVFGWWITLLGVGMGIWSITGWTYQYYRDEYQH